MSESDQDLQAQLEQLKQLYEQGLISEANYRAALMGLGVEPSAVFDLREHQVARRQVTLAVGASPEALRSACLHRLAQQTRRLPLSGVDPKAVSDQGSDELQLSAVYTALLTRRLETDGDAAFSKSPSFREGKPATAPPWACSTVNRTWSCWAIRAAARGTVSDAQRCAIDGQ